MSLPVTLGCSVTGFFSRARKMQWSQHGRCSLLYTDVAPSQVLRSDNKESHRLLEVSRFFGDMGEGANSAFVLSIY